MANKSIEGSLVVGNAVTVGGRAVVRGSLSVAGALRVGRIVDHCRGLFTSADALAAGVPRPEPGMWAFVIDSEDTMTATAEALVYVVEDGAWVSTGKVSEFSGLEPVYDLADMIASVEASASEATASATASAESATASAESATASAASATAAASSAESSAASAEAAAASAALAEQYATEASVVALAGSVITQAQEAAEAAESAASTAEAAATSAESAAALATEAVAQVTENATERFYAVDGSEDAEAVTGYADEEGAVVYSSALGMFAMRVETGTAVDDNGDAVTVYTYYTDWDEAGLYNSDGAPWPDKVYICTSDSKVYVWDVTGAELVGAGADTQTEIDGITATLEELQVLIESNATAISTLNATVSALNSTLAAVVTDYSELESIVTAVQESVDTLTEETTETTETE